MLLLIVGGASVATSEMLIGTMANRDRVVIRQRVLEKKVAGKFVDIIADSRLINAVFVFFLESQARFFTLTTKAARMVVLEELGSEDLAVNE